MDDDTINKTIWSTIGLYKKSPRNQKHAISTQIIKEINNLHLNCMCNMIKYFGTFELPEEIMFVFLNKCKMTCNFCQIKYINKIQKEYVHKLKSHNYLKIFKLEDIVQNVEICNKLIESNTLAHSQLLQIIKANDKISFTSEIVSDILKLFIESNFDTTRVSYEILILMLNKENFVELYSKLLTDFIVTLIKADKLDIFDDKNITCFTNNDNVLNHAIIYCSHDKLEKMIDRCAEI
jgi:hypothetical protein